MKLNIIDVAAENTDYREVLKTGADSQLVIMSIPPGEDIGEEMYADVDQITFIVQGEGELEMAGEEDSELHENEMVFVPAGKSHNITNTGDTDLKLFTIYAPPEYQPDTLQETKQEALEDEGIVEMDERDLYEQEALEEDY